MNLNKEFTTDGLTAQLGCAPTSVPTALRFLRGNDWDIIKVGRARYICRSIGSLVIKDQSEQIPFMPKHMALKEAEAPEVPAPSHEAVTIAGLAAGDLLEISHVTRQGQILAMDQTGNVYKVSPL